MSDKDSKYTEISDELMNSLRAAYKVGTDTAGEECPMSEIAISYAARELDTEENQKFRDHLHTCKFCLDLVLDVQVAEAESKTNNEQPSKVLPALSKALRKPRNYQQSDSHLNRIKELFSKFCLPLLSPKSIGVAVTACLAFIIINYGLKDSEVTQKLDNINKKMISPGNKEKQLTVSNPEIPTKQDAQKEKSDGKINPYEPTGKINPFDPLFRGKSTVVKKKKRMKRIPQTPLQRLDLSQLKLVGIILSDNGNKALLEDSNGKGYMVSKGTYIGRYAGKVIQIKKDRIIIEEEFEDLSGKITTKNRELILQNKMM